MKVRNWFWACVAAGAAAGIVLLFTADPWLRTRCQAPYEGKATVIGTEFTALGLEYHKNHPALSNDELLFDAGGVAQRVWAAESISRCRLALNAGITAKIALALLLLVAATRASAIRRFPLLPRRKTPVQPAPTPGLHSGYDVFISYRHEQSDITFAQELLAHLEGAGYRVAIDERDFRPNEHFLQEMERCIRESRYTLCVISANYLQSDNCFEEAIICKVLDMGERKRRLIPLFLAPVSLPVWLYGLVGIDFGAETPLVDPVERLKNTLGAAVTQPAPPTSVQSPKRPN
jgi:TIR domain